MTGRVLRRTLAAGAAIALSAGALRAQEFFPTPSVGVRSGYAFTQQSPIVGLSSSVPLMGRLEFVFGGDILIAEADERWRLSIEAVVRIGPVGEYYAGAGAGLVDLQTAALGTDRSQFIYTAIAGREFRRETAALRPFVEPRWSILDGRPAFTLGIGINYALETPF